MHAKFINILVKVAKYLNQLKVGWVLGGSTATFLHGLDIVPKDIDILTSKHESYEIAKHFSKSFETVKEMSYGETDIFASHYGIFKYHNTVIEVMGDLVIKSSDSEFFVPFPVLLKVAKQVFVRDTSILIVPLEWQLIANIMIPGKEERVKKIARYLRKNGWSLLILNTLSKYAPKKILNHAKMLLMPHL